MVVNIVFVVSFLRYLSMSTFMLGIKELLCLRGLLERSFSRITTL